MLGTSTISRASSSMCLGTWGDVVTIVPLLSLLVVGSLLVEAESNGFAGCWALLCLKVVQCSVTNMIVRSIVPPMTEPSRMLSRFRRAASSMFLWIIIGR